MRRGWRSLRLDEIDLANGNQGAAVTRLRVLLRRGPQVRCVDRVTGNAGGVNVSTGAHHEAIQHHAHTRQAADQRRSTGDFVQRVHGAGGNIDTASVARDPVDAPDLGPPAQ